MNKTTMTEMLETAETAYLSGNLAQARSLAQAAIHFGAAALGLLDRAGNLLECLEARGA